MNTPAASQACGRPAGPTARPGSDFEESGSGEPRLAVSQLFHLGQLTATPEVIRAAHARRRPTDRGGAAPPRRRLGRR